MSDRPDIPEDDDVLAAEFALRLLEGDAFDAAQRRALSDRAFAELVASWNARLADLAEEVGPVAPSEAARRQLMDRLFAESTVQAGVSSIWRVLGIGGLVVSALLAILLIRAPFADPDVVYVSEVVSEDGSFRYLAVIDTKADTIRLLRTDGSPPAVGSMELWGHAPDDPPVSFGVISVDSRTTVPVPEVLRSAADGLILAVSNEPEGGSPTGQPTGEVLASGTASEL